MAKNKNDWRRRAALSIATQLPEDCADAVKVLEYAREIVDKFLCEDQHVPRLASANSALSMRVLASKDR